MFSGAKISIDARADFLGMLVGQKHDGTGGNPYIDCWNLQCFYHHFQPFSSCLHKP